MKYTMYEDYDGAFFILAGNEMISLEGNMFHYDFCELAEYFDQVKKVVIFRYPNYILELQTRATVLIEFDNTEVRETYPEYFI